MGSREAVIKQWRTRSRKERSISQSKIMKTRWKDPKYRKLFSKIQSLAQKKRFEDPKELERVSIRAKISMRKKAKDSKWYAKRCKIAKELGPKIGKTLSKVLRKLYASGERKPAGGGYSNCKRGKINSTKGGSITYYSSWELCFIQLLDSSKLVRKFSYEPFGISYMFKGKSHTYFPDFGIKLTNGDYWIVEIKGQLTTGDKRKYKAAYNFCATKGYKWAVISEKPTMPLTAYLQ